MTAPAICVLPPSPRIFDKNEILGFETYILYYPFYFLSRYKYKYSIISDLYDENVCPGLLSNKSIQHQVTFSCGGGQGNLRNRRNVNQKFWSLQISYL